VQGDATQHSNPSKANGVARKPHLNIALNAREPAHGPKRARPSAKEPRHTRHHKSIKDGVLNCAPLTLKPERGQRTGIENELPQQLKRRDTRPTGGTRGIPPQLLQPSHQLGRKDLVDLGTSFEANKPGTQTDHLKASWVRTNPPGAINFNKGVSNGDVHVRQRNGRLLIGVAGQEQLLIQCVVRTTTLRASASA